MAQQDPTAAGPPSPPAGDADDAAGLAIGSILAAAEALHRGFPASALCLCSLAAVHVDALRQCAEAARAG